MYFFSLVLISNVPENEIPNILLKRLVTPSEIQKKTYPDSQKMGSNFQKIRNCFSVKVVYPDTENHTQHQTIQSMPTDSALKLRGHL